MSTRDPGVEAGGRSGRQGALARRRAAEACKARRALLARRLACAAQAHGHTREGTWAAGFGRVGAHAQGRLVEDL